MLGVVGYNENDERIIIEENVFQLDGYRIAERLLEGVMFDIFLKDGKIHRIQVEEDSKEYFESLNTKKYYKEIKDYVQERILDPDEQEVQVSKGIMEKYNIDYAVVEEL